MGRIKSTGPKQKSAPEKPRGDNKSGGDGGDDLKMHIRALGGDVEEDYELVKDAGSDVLADVDYDARDEDPRLAKDVAKFMKKLDFGSVRGAAVVDDEESAGGDEVAEDASKEEEDPVVHAAQPEAVKVAEANRTGKPKFIVPPTTQWYLAAPALAPSPSLAAPSPALLTSSTTRAASLLERDTTTYTSSSSHTSSSTSDARFLTRILASGTLSDRLSALTLLAQGSPVHNTRALDSLKAMASKKGREESLKALRAVVDWWVGGGGPDRKLKYFRDQPLTHPDATEQHLVLWYFEDWLKKYFFSILQLLEGLSMDPLPYVRMQAMNLIFQLLRDKPEQEQNLLRLLVHKLSDAEKAVASKASHYLLQLLQTHPNMKNIIVHDVSALILRPPGPATSSAAPKTAAPQTEGKTHARYYAVITFNQIFLSPADKDVAARLVDVYFELFRELLGEGAVAAEAPDDEHEQRDFTPKQRRGYKDKQKGKNAQKDRKGKGRAADLGFHEVPDSSSKLVSQILTGINRALPFAKTENSATFDAHIDTLFRITHTATFNVSLQALMLIQHVTKARPAIADRFYRALYASLVDGRLATSSKQAMYLNLLFRAVKADRSLARVAAFVRRIVQVLSGHQPAFICGGLYLLGELFSTAPEVRDMTSVGRTEADAEAYDPRKRDPQFAHATASCLWELLPLRQHYHPSVALHARQLLTHTRVTATADLGLNTLAHFLDRFVYRNPRAPRTRGASAMQPAAATGDAFRATRADAAEAVNVESFWQRKEGDVPVDQIFFHKFFSKKHEKEVERAGKSGRRKGRRANGAEDGGSGDESGEDKDGSEGQSDAEENEIWKAMKASVPELGASDVDDDSLQDISEEYGKEDTEDEKISDGSEPDFFEDSDDLLSDAVDPPGLIEYASDSASENEGQDGDEEEEWQGVGTRRRKRVHADGEENRKRKKLRGLPTFASYEDYAGMIERDADDNV